jgi:hypothetical protein
MSNRDFPWLALTVLTIPTFPIFVANLIRSPAARSETVHSGGVRWFTGIMIFICHIARASRL